MDAALLLAALASRAGDHVDFLAMDNALGGVLASLAGGANQSSHGHNAGGGIPSCPPAPPPHTVQTCSGGHTWHSCCSTAFSCRPATTACSVRSSEWGAAFCQACLQG